MSSDPETTPPQAPAGVDDAIARYRRHDNPFGTHPDGIGTTLGEDVAEDVPPDEPARVS